MQSLGTIEDHAQLPLRDVMVRLSHEMGDLAGAMHRMQSLISLLVREDAFHDGKNVHEMQSLDLIAQKIECLSDFVAGICQDMPAFWRVDTREAANLIVLSDLAARLTCSDRPDEMAATSAGDFEAF